MQGVVTSGNSIRAGIELSVLRNWAKAPKKGKLAAKLLKAGILNIEQYMNLENGRSKFWNDKNMVSIFYNTGLDIYGIASAINMTPKSINKHITEGGKKVGTRLEQLKSNLGI
jgi:hypothetical protein